MTQYISKSVVIAEIERLKDEAKIHPSYFGCGRLSICKELMNLLDTIEVKDVNPTDAFIEKACDLLADNYSKYITTNGLATIFSATIDFDTIRMIEDFKKAMEK